jgi:uncharacterized phage-like protein YoqJ
LIITLDAVKSTHPHVIGLTGMAQGVDQAFARACLATQIPFRAYLPFPEHSAIWPAHAQQIYRELLAKADWYQVVRPYVNTPHDIRQALMDRNSALVDECDAAIAVWTGALGGTADAVRKLRAAGRPLLILHPYHAYRPSEVSRWITDIVHRAA